MLSTSWKLNKEDYTRIFRQIVIIYSPVLLLFLSQIQDGNFDTKIIYALIISTTIDIIRRLITDYSKNGKT